MEIEGIFRATFFVLFAAVMAVRAYSGWKIRRADGSGWLVQDEAVEREGA